VDRVRLGHLLERLRRRDRDARLGHVLRRPLGQPRAVSGRGEEWLGQHAGGARPADGQARRAALLSAIDPHSQAASRFLQPGGIQPWQDAVRRQGEVRHVPRAAALHRAGQQPARARRDRRRRLPGRSLTDAHVPHGAARRALGAPEGRVLPRRSVRDPARRRQPLRRVFQARVERPGEASWST